MQKKYTSLGLMSGTSGDGVDASIINSNGIDQFEIIKNEYFEYDSDIYDNFHSLKEKIFTIKDLKKFSEDLLNLERKITFFHAKIIKKIYLDNYNDALVGFHGQTIYHNAKERISKQLGDGQLLNQLTNRKIVFNFRKNDILNGGEGAPLTPIFHQLIATQKNIELPTCILNIGGISNLTIIKKPIGSMEIFSRDIGPGNCLIDSWVRKNSKKKFDYNGQYALSGKKNEIIFEQAQELYSNRIEKEKISLDTGDFDISFARGISLEDGAATLTDFTASLISEGILSLLSKHQAIKNIILSGGGRKNEYLIKKIKENVPSNLSFELIDKYEINGDFVESQAFAFLAIRTYKKLPITFPNTTNCNQACVGGEIVDN